MQAVSHLPHQHLRGIDSKTWRRNCYPFDQIDLFDASQVELPPMLAEWAETSPEKSSFKLQLKLDGLDSHFREALVTRPAGNDNTHFEEFLDLTDGAGGLFDCGYFRLECYHEITDAGNYFVMKLHSTKLHSNIEPEHVAES